MKNKTFYRDVARAVAGNSFDVIRPSYNVPDFSERHKERMEKLFEKKRVFTVFYIIPKRVLIAILIALTVLAVPLSVKAIREPLFRFFSQTFGGQKTEIFASEEERQRALNAKIESDYQPYFIPVGYSLVSEDHTDTHNFYEFSDGVKTFSIEQKMVSVSAPYVPDGAVLVSDDMEISPWDIKYYRYDNKILFIWLDYRYEFRLVADDTMYLGVVKEIASNFLDEIGYEEKKIVEAGLTGELDETERPTDIWDVELPPETLPEEFGFRLPDGMSVSYWQDYSISWAEYLYIDVECETENKENAMFISIHDNKILGNFSSSDIETIVKINDEVTISYFKNVSCWYWIDDKYVYHVHLFDETIPHEEIFKMIREYYGIK